MPINYDLLITPEMKQEQAKIDLLDFAAQKRWEKEVGGITLNGLPLATDDRSKALITGARLAAETNPLFTTEWKGADGTFVTVDAPMVIGISDAMLAHVQACFALEAQVITEIEHGTIATREQISEAFT